MEESKTSKAMDKLTLLVALVVAVTYGHIHMCNDCTCRTAVGTGVDSNHPLKMASLSLA